VAGYRETAGDYRAQASRSDSDRQWMDLDRVGAFGQSGGGFATVRGMLDFPEMYKAGVALSGSHDPRYFNPGFVEPTTAPTTPRPGPVPPTWTSQTG
jgi:hypothetical protein